MTELVKGGNAPLQGTDITVKVAWKDRDPTAEELDVSVFMLGDDKKVRSDDDMIFYGQRQAKDGSVKITDLAVADDDGRATSLTVDLSKVTPGVTSMAVVGTTGASAGGRKISDLGRLSVAATPAGGSPVSFAVDTGPASEAALILGELYLRNGAWKFRAVGQGFNGGLAPLARQYGVDIADEPAPTAPPPPPKPAPAPTPPSGAPAVNLSKVTLTKSSPTVNLSKKSAGFGQMEINLNWNPGEKKKGFLGFGGKGIDLDLGCLFEMSNGQMGAVQALGNSFGSFAQSPFIELAGDDRSGTSTDGEWMRINGSQWSQIKRVLVFAFIYEGVPNWAAANGTVTIYLPDDAPVEVRMDEASNLGMCAIAELSNSGGDLRMTRHVEYFRGHPDMSDRFNFHQLQWKRGSK